MHENRRANARTTWLPLLLAFGAWTGPALAQGPGASPTAGSPTAGSPAAGSPAPASAPRPAQAAPAAGTPAKPASAAPSATASAKPRRKLPMRACPAKVPEELNPPPDVTLETVLPASGVQSYACLRDKPGEAPDWAPKGPHATLGEGNNLMGIHFGGPSWQAMDGSLVKGTKISSASAPDKSAIVWLLLSGAASGEGIFGKITHIQRMDTVGGKPPQGGCDAEHLDTRVLVPYRTNYYFYREAAPGETVRQCRGAASKAAVGDKPGKDKSVSAQAAASKPSSDKPGTVKVAADKPPSKGSVEKAAKATSSGSAAEKAATEKPARE